LSQAQNQTTIHKFSLPKSVKRFVSNITIRFLKNGLLCINGRNFEVHAVNGGKDVGRPLHHALAGLWHGDGGAPRQKDGLVPRTEWKNP